MVAKGAPDKDGAFFYISQFLYWWDVAPAIFGDVVRSDGLQATRRRPGRPFCSWFISIWGGRCVREFRGIAPLTRI